MTSVNCVVRQLVPRLRLWKGSISGLSFKVWALDLGGSSAKETYHFQEPTNRSHPTTSLDFRFRV